ncbi:MAG: hypothetical protein ACI9HK_001019, partial [Pirellulaceae bacterium]
MSQTHPDSKSTDLLSKFAEDIFAQQPLDSGDQTGSNSLAESNQATFESESLESRVLLSATCANFEFAAQLNGEIDVDDVDANIPQDDPTAVAVCAPQEDLLDDLDCSQPCATDDIPIFQDPLETPSPVDPTPVEPVAETPTPVDEVADPPLLEDPIWDVEDQWGTTNEDTPLQTPNVLNSTSGEDLQLVSFDQPSNGVVVYNNDGTFTYTPAADFSGSDSFQYTVEDDDGNEQSAVFDVTITPDADSPILTAADAKGPQDSPIPLDIDFALQDTDGSETGELIVTGPTGISFNNGTEVAPGTWEFTADDLAGLTVTPPTGFTGEFQLWLAGKSTETDNGDVATESADITVCVQENLDDTADEPNLDVESKITGDQDTAIPLNITASLNDTDGSETLSLLVTGVPEGATLSAGTLDVSAGGYWLTSDQLDGLTITPPAGFSGEFDMWARAFST